MCNRENECANVYECGEFMSESVYVCVLAR